MLDLRSTADYWWLQEFTRNDDAYRTGSTYLYKFAGGSYDGEMGDIVESHNEGETITIKDASVRDGYRWRFAGKTP